MRIDVYLVNHGIVESRSKASDLVASGFVYLVTISGERIQITKPSQRVPEGSRVEVEASEEFSSRERFVSRGGIKMQGALEHTGIQVRGLDVLDVGISTGGFTDCLLQAGVGRVIGVDVGHGQLAPSLSSDPRLTVFEGVNARDLSVSPLTEMRLQNSFDLIVIDVSFISLTLVLPEVIKFMKDSGHLLALVKPQFEVGKGGLGKKGIVKSVDHLVQVEAKIKSACHSLNLIVEDYFESSIRGLRGNREFFLQACRGEV